MGSVCQHITLVASQSWTETAWNLFLGSVFHHQSGATISTMATMPILVTLAALSWSTFAQVETPIKTCCPPAHFLAIEDWQESRQTVEGIWYSQKPADALEGAYGYRYLSGYQDWLPIMQVNNLIPEHKTPVRHGRHYYITRVSCVPNEKNLPPIDGFQRSSESSLPEFATWDDRKNNRKLFSNRSHPLAEGQMLKSIGHQLPSCPVQALSTMVLGDGRSNGFIDRPTGRYRHSYAFSSAFLRINASGRLVGEQMDQIGLPNLRMGWELPYEWHDEEEGSWESPEDRRKEPQLPPPADDTDLGVDFCLTWSSDPRISTTTVADLGLEFDPSEEKPFEEYVNDGGPLNLLEAVYCDPCKAKVLCSLVTKNIWPLIRPYIDPTNYLFDPNELQVAFFFPYLDTNKDGKVSVWEVYDGRVVEILRSIFDGLDVNGNGVLEKSEAIPENLFRPKFIRNIIAEMFKLADRNQDTSLTVDDVPPLYCASEDDCYAMDPDCNQMEVEECVRMYPSKGAMYGKLKLKKAEDYCYTLYRLSMSDKLQECKNQISTYLPLLDQNGDSRLTLAEIQDPLIRFVQFLMGQSGKLVGVDEIVSGLEKLGESPEVTNPLRQYLRPALATLPMKILQALVASGDLDGDGGLNWEEFEGFGNFDFVANWFGYARCSRDRGGEGCKVWETGFSKEVKALLGGMEICEHKSRTDKTCFPATANHQYFRRYISEPKVLERLLQNLLFHKDFLFPSWQE